MQSKCGNKYYRQNIILIMRGANESLHFELDGLSYQNSIERLERIRYTSDEIEETFVDGRPVLGDGQTFMDHKPLKVVIYKGKMYSLNNKHLFALRKNYGPSRNIHVHVVPFREAKNIFYKKFTSTSDGRNCTLIKRDESSGSLEYYITDGRAKNIFEDEGFGKVACSVVFLTMTCMTAFVAMHLILY